MSKVAHSVGGGGWRGPGPRPRAHRTRCRACPAPAPAPLDVIVGQDPGEGAPAATGQRVAEDKTRQAIRPGVAVFRGEAQCGAMLGVATPAHAGLAQPRAYAGQIGLAEVEAARHGRGLDERHHD